MLCYSMSAQNTLIEAARKAANNTEEAANSLDGSFTGKTFKVTNVDGKRMMTSLEVMGDMRGEDVFVKTLSWMIQQGNNLKEYVKDVDYQNMRVVYEQPMKSEKSSSLSYKYSLTVQVDGNLLSFTIDNIEMIHTGLLNSYRATPFDKLNPEKTKKHLETIKDFESVMSQKLCAMLNYVEMANVQRVTHWDEVIRGNIVKGMNETECLLSMGKPKINDMAGGNNRWVYDARTYIFFTDGRVSTFLK